jgi:hypothetical protein
MLLISMLLLAAQTPAAARSGSGLEWMVVASFVVPAVILLLLITIGTRRAK